MQRTTKVAIAALTVIVMSAGCAIQKHDYKWTEYPVASQRVTSQLRFEGKTLRIIKGKSDTTIKDLGSVGVHHYYGNLQMLSDAIADQLAKELRNRGLGIEEGAQKSLEVSVESSAFEQGAWKIAGTLVVALKLGNGRTKSYTVRNSSPGTVDRTYDGAVALTVIEILNDQDVMAYVGE